MKKQNKPASIEMTLILFIHERKDIQLLTLFVFLFFCFLFLKQCPGDEA